MTTHTNQAKRVAFVGSGAMGCYIGARMAHGGIDVTLIDPWPEHIDTMKRNGVVITGTQGAATVPIRALHIYEVQSLIAQPIDIAFIAVKSYDTEWATMLIKEYLSPDGFVVSLQNGINEERIANIVGWGKTLGCIASTIGLSIKGPGHADRSYHSGGPEYTVFRVGEIHGRNTERVQGVAAMLRCVDSAEVTTDLWGERWSKLAANSMHNGLAAITGLGHIGIYTQPEPRALAIRLGAEAVRVGRALGFNVEVVRGIPAAALEDAGYGDDAARHTVEEVIRGWMPRLTDEARPSTAQDMIKGRRSEIEFINGVVVAKAAEIGIPVPAQNAITDLVRRCERGELAPDVSNIAGI